MPRAPFGIASTSLFPKLLLAWRIAAGDVTIEPSSKSTTRIDFEPDASTIRVEVLAGRETLRGSHTTCYVKIEAGHRALVTPHEERVVIEPLAAAPAGPALPPPEEVVPPARAGDLSVQDRRALTVSDELRPACERT